MVIKKKEPKIADLAERFIFQIKMHPVLDAELIDRFNNYATAKHRGNKSGAGRVLIGKALDAMEQEQQRKGRAKD